MQSFLGVKVNKLNNAWRNVMQEWMKWTLFMKFISLTFKYFREIWITIVCFNFSNRCDIAIAFSVDIHILAFDTYFFASTAFLSGHLNMASKTGGCSFVFCSLSSLFFIKPYCSGSFSFAKLQILKTFYKIK